jgi:hypothetical protein
VQIASEKSLFFAAFLFVRGSRQGSEIEIRVQGSGFRGKGLGFRVLRVQS